ncbi:DNA polymerase III subunit alpha [Marinicrinis sediminis]|uniref:DNA polymerase III subunit alpha n=1 Tax=Marinicrinis sediminis TaxID=1652465 RepID=A0ABW5R9C2_9BACL
MSPSDFVHLHVHSEYSLLDGAAKIQELAASAAQKGMKALALTDHGVMYGAIPFYKACKKHGLKPIIGCEVYMTAGSIEQKLPRHEQPIYHLILLAQNEEGYRNLMRLTSVAHLEGFHYKPRVDERLLRQHHEGIIALSACLGSEVSQQLLHDNWEEAVEAARKYADIFPDRFYLELQDHGLIEQKQVNERMIELSRHTGLPLIATNDVHYMEEPDASVQEVLICIGTGKTLEDEDRLRFHTSQMYLKSPDEMMSLFPHVSEAIANTCKVADQCNLELDFELSILPRFSPIPEGRNEDRYLRELCEQGLQARYAETAEWNSAEFQDKLKQRLDYELQTISRMGYSDYFLIVWDFIRYAHSQGIVTGPGRGSSAGSLVAYVLQITDVDPIRYGLLFERFLNPERVTMPDIDIDFNDLRRDEVIAYVSDKYGRDHVAQIITFGTMAARAAIRDVGRVMSVPFYEVDKAAKLIPHQVGMTLAKALEISPELQKLRSSSQKVSELLHTAQRVEGMPRHASTHAAGVVISREALTDHVPLQEGSEGIPLTQYSMEHLESIGLLKMDFLGLRTLSIIERTLQWVKELTGEELDLKQIPLHDPLTYEMLSHGDTTGVFQLESAGMRRVLKELKPTEFEDIISVLALYRPGPMEYIGQYIAGKHGKAEVVYPHPTLEPILKETYGIIVYQEQIMQIASRMAGFSLGEADLLRRAVSKKKREILDQERTHFVEGCVHQGHRPEEANHVYDMIVRFADYGFPKAHATAYGVLAFQTAYLKAHYPAAFMASMLTAVTGNQGKTAEYVEECKRMDIAVLPPDVNESGMYFTPVPVTGESDKRAIIRFGLAAVKNVGYQAIESITASRKSKPYHDLLSFCQQVDLRVCNKRVIESLIQAGAFDSMEGHRAQLIAVLDDAVEMAMKWKKESEDLQLHLFGFQEEANWELDLPEIRPYDPMQQLELEKEMTGLFISGHPLDAYQERLAGYSMIPLHTLSEQAEHTVVNVAGMLQSVKPILTKKGKQMAFAELEDRFGKVEVVIFPESWQTYSSLLTAGKLVILKGKVQHQEEQTKIICEKVMSMDDLKPLPVRSLSHGGAASHKADQQEVREAPEGSYQTVLRSEKGDQAQARSSEANSKVTWGDEAEQNRDGAAQARGENNRGVRNRTVSPGAKLYIKISSHREHPTLLKQLQDILLRHAGDTSVILFYERTEKPVALSAKYDVTFSKALVEEVEKWMGKGAVAVK